MKTKAITTIMLTLFLASMLSVAFNTAPVSADSNAYDPWDHDKDPATPDADTDGWTIYADTTLTQDLYFFGDGITIGANGITIDGDGYTLQGLGGWYPAGFFLFGRSGVTIKNVIIKGWYRGIKLWGSDGNTISENTITDNHYYGISLGSSSGNTIIENTITDSDHSIYLDHSSGNTISGNTLENGWDGVRVYYESSSNTISGNTITDNGKGIFVFWHSSSNTISGNTITDNDYGINLFYSGSGNTMSENTVSNNYWGIALSRSYGNLIYHNNIIDNEIQVYDSDPAENDWHHLDLLEGNYWSDYEGKDIGDQTYVWDPTEKHLIAGDGIGDTLVPHPAEYYDYYPLMNPWTPVPPVVTATVDINPDTLNLKSKGKWITTYIELPDGYDMADIDVDTIQLDGTILAKPHPTDIGDHDEDGIPDLMVKFDRQVLIGYLKGLGVKDGDEVELTVTGKVSGTQFEGSDTIRVVSKGKGN